MARYKSIIGRYEVISFPDYLLPDVPAKVDTGANYSSIHAEGIKLVKKKGVEHLQFTLMNGHDSYDFSRSIAVKEFRSVQIENSFGHSEPRYVITLKCKLANKIFKTDFTLANRGTKTFPILLGRKLLDGRFIIDTSVNNISSKMLKGKLAEVVKEEEKKA